MVFITAGMGGGTGTGAAPVIAQDRPRMGILTVGIVTSPFQWEGRKSQATSRGRDRGNAQCGGHLLVINNDRLRDLYGNLSLDNAFEHADNVLTTAARGIAEIITKTGKVNVDFEDVKTVMTTQRCCHHGHGRGRRGGPFTCVLRRRPCPSPLAQRQRYQRGQVRAVEHHPR
jgi:cell division protein FtsZ